MKTIRVDRDNKYVMFARSVLVLFIFSTFFIQANEKNTNWFTMFGLGPAYLVYNDKIGAMIDNAKARGCKRSSLAMDIYGFYFPALQKTLVGGIANIIGDFLFYNISRKELAVSQLLVGPSVLHFFTEMRRGYFLRFDAGLARFSVDGNRYDNSVNKTYTSCIGYGFLTAFGYSFKSNSAADTLFNVSFAGRFMDKTTIFTATSGVGFLF